MHDPIAYTYEADHHCEGCALERFGRDEHGDITGTDSEGNPVGIVAPWDEWIEPSIDGPQTLACGTCGGIIEEYEGEDEGGITPEGTALGHRYTMGNVNAYCPKCSEEQGITVLDCDYDLDK